MELRDEIMDDIISRLPDKRPLRLSCRRGRRRVDATVQCITVRSNASMVVPAIDSTCGAALVMEPT